MEPWSINSEIFIHPFNCIISGPTMSGKTFLLKEILKNKDVLIKPSPNKIIYCYKEWQSIYDNFKIDVPGIIFVDGLVRYDEIDMSFNNLIIFDDLMNEAIQSKDIMNIFTIGSHHKNTSTFLISQNMFAKGKFARDISLNSNYMIIFHNPRDQQQIAILARQMYPNNSKFLIESFNDVSKNPHGYLLIDLKQTTDHRNRIQSNILPTQKRIIYVSKSL